ncbi:MAG TPA: alpha-ketoacid dehydrogenase subunit beta [Dehalococcoidia bacterium]|nr:alpha-ketoacid dehydrogenase subunit beta [Dehalococcoidia bacterium]
MPEVTYRDALRSTLHEALSGDDRYFMMGEDIGAYGGSYSVTKGFLEEFGHERIRDAPIAESVIVGAGVGAAMGGLRPIVELMTINFSFLAFDQIINTASKVFYMSNGQINVPIVIRMASGGGSQLGAQHSHSLEGWYAHVPGLKVCVPGDPYDAKGLLRTALKDNNPVIFIEHTALYAKKGDVPDEYYDVPFGKLDIEREGTDVTLIGYGGSVSQVLQAADLLSEQGVSAECLDLRTLRPLDVDGIVGSVKKTNRVVIVEDDWRFGGFGGELSSIIQEQAFDYLDAPVQRVCGADVPMPYNKNLEAAALPQPEDIVDAVMAIR